MLGAYNIDSDEEEEEEEVQSNVPKSASTHIQELEKVVINRTRLNFIIYIFHSPTLRIPLFFNEK